MYKPTKSQKKKEIVEKIEKFSDFNVLYSLRKPRSPQSIVIIEEKDDSWFIHIVYYRTKSGVITDDSMIIASDLNSRLDHLQRIGWK